MVRRSISGFIVGAALLACTGCLIEIVVDTPTGEQIIETITVEEAYDLISQYADDPDFVILDVRAAAEYAPQHIDGALNINYYDYDFEDQLDDLDKNKVYLIYCKSGGRSGNTLTLMEELGFAEVYNLDGGITAWNAAGQETVVCEVCGY